jgi:hypothetical protein
MPIIRTQRLYLVTRYLAVLVLGIFNSYSYAASYSVGLIMTSSYSNRVGPIQPSVVNCKAVAWYEWGHTAITVLEDHTPIKTVGFNPHELEVFNSGDVRNGRQSVPGRYYDDSALFALDESFLIEWAVTKEEADELVRRLPEVTGNAAEEFRYTAQPDFYQDTHELYQNFYSDHKLKAAHNCISWAIPFLENFFGSTLQMPEGTIREGRKWPQQGHLIASVKNEIEQKENATSSGFVLRSNDKMGADRVGLVSKVSNSFSLSRTSTAISKVTSVRRIDFDYCSLF